MSQPTAIIIGGGLGGLFTAALLSRQGHAVTVLEQNAVAGGGLQTFRRGGVTFETGMHVLGGLRPGGSVYRICQYLGIADQLQLRDVDDHCMDAITYLSPAGDARPKTYRVPCGRQAFTDYFVAEFPHEADHVRQYVDALYRLASEVDFFYLRPQRDDLFAHSEQFLWPASTLISHYITDPRLRDVLAYMNPMYGGVYGHTPAYIHALINVLYIDGPSRFVGGSQQLADALCRVIAQGGGRVLTGQRVTALHVDDARIATAVQTAAGLTLSADSYVSAIHPARLLLLTDAHAFSKAFRQRVDAMPNSYSAFVVYIKLRPGAFPYINHTCYFQEDYGLVWTHADYDAARWPRGFMYLTPPEAGSSPYATKMIVNCLMPFSVVARWAGTTVGRRGDDYLSWKQWHASRVLDRLEALHPGFRACVDSVWSSSPLTIRDYYGQPEGALYGVRKDCADIMLTQLPVRTKVHNLLLTGQNVNLHGICGVPLTAVQTAAAIAGPIIIP